MPKVSIGIPAYDAARYLPAAIQSALAQSFEDFEVFVGDNVSQDETPALCASVTDGRFRYVRFDRHVGQPANWNRCLQQARGDYIVLLHADDLLSPLFVRRAADVLDGNPSVVLVHSAVTHIDAQANALPAQRYLSGDRIETGRHVLERLLMEGCFIKPAGVMVRRAAYRAAGPFDEGVTWGADWDMWLRLCLEGDVAYLGDPLASYREHSASGTARVVASGRNGEDELAVIDKLFRLAAVERGLQLLHDRAVACAAHRTWCWAEEACRLGYRKAARGGIRAALRMDPRLMLKSRVWGLWLSSFVGYEWFERAKALKRALKGLSETNGRKPDHPNV